MTSVAPQYNAAILQWYLDNGVDEALEPVPNNRLARKEVASNILPVTEGVAQKSEPPKVHLPEQSLKPVDEILAEAAALAQNAQNIDALKAAITQFDGLAIRKTAMNMVFADGNPSARVMVIGDVPESDEDRVGKPFMGDHGTLLDKMFAAIGLTRGGATPADSLYITQLLNWRPPGNRSPNPTEISVSHLFLERHIALMKPEYIVVMGNLATKTLCGGTPSKLRGGLTRFVPRFPDMGAVECGCLVTHAPSVLLKAPAKKREAWDDLLALQAALK